MQLSTPESGSLSVPAAPANTLGGRIVAVPGGLVRTARAYPFPAVCAAIILVIGISSGLADILPLADPERADPVNRLQSPSSSHWFGTDGLGRDVLARVIHGGRLTLLVSVASVGVSITVATTIGVTSGYLRGWFDIGIQRLVDMLQSLPGLIIVITLFLFIGPGSGPDLSAKLVLIIGIAFVLLGGGIRVSRGATLQIASLPFVEAALTIGASTPRILFRHIAPNIFAPMVVIATAFLGIAILIEATASFLGFSVEPPTPAWGDMLGNDGRAAMIEKPLLSVWPGLAIFLTVFSFNIIGDALRDALDPRLRGSR